MGGEEVNEVWKGCSGFTLDATEKEQVELPVAGGGTSLHSIAKETCQGQGCNAATDRPDDFTTTTQVETTQAPSTTESTPASSQSVLISIVALVMSLML